VEDGACSPALGLVDPNLGPLANNGGPTQTHALLTSPTVSPAIDAGASCPSIDQRSVSRPQGAGCDIGAFELDSTYPTVVTTSLQPSYTTGPLSFTVNFSENLNDPFGDSDIKDVTNPANYLVIEKGSNGLANTVSCTGGVQTDDTYVPVTSVTFNASLYRATVNFASALPVGSYRLFVCGTTSIRDIALTPLNGGTSDFTFDFTVGATSTRDGNETTASYLPKTGFAPGKVTILPAQPADLAYAKLGDIWLEIPSLNVKSTIVGVPQNKDKTWDVSWLGNDIGWLNGTAFPSWTGNSVLTAHVTNANGLQGPFSNIKSLKYGDQIIVHMDGYRYIFEVRKSTLVRPETTDFALEHLEDASYLTLLTCQGFNDQNDAYRFRRVVRAVLVNAQKE
jgi:LPXTG-site transpeptidase (sortase) family protein